MKLGAVLEACDTSLKACPAASSRHADVLSCSREDSEDSGFAFPRRNSPPQSAKFKGMLDNSLPPEVMQDFLDAAHDPQRFQEYISALTGVREQSPLHLMLRSLSSRSSLHGRLCLAQAQLPAGGECHAQLRMPAV